MTSNKFSKRNFVGQRTIDEKPSRALLYRWSASSRTSVEGDEQTAVKQICDDVIEECRHKLMQQHMTNDDLNYRNVTVDIVDDNEEETYFYIDNEDNKLRRVIFFEYIMLGLHRLRFAIDLYRCIMSHHIISASRFNIIYHMTSS